MTHPFQRILCPVDFDDNSMQALDTAANLARENNGTVFVLHVVPMIIAPTGMPVYVDLYKGQEEAARTKLLEVAHKRLGGRNSDRDTDSDSKYGAYRSDEFLAFNR